METQASVCLGSPCPVQVDNFKEQIIDLILNIRTICLFFDRSNRECPFVLEKKGKEFVEDCQVRRQQLEKSFLLT